MIISEILISLFEFILNLLYLFWPGYIISFIPLIFGNFLIVFILGNYVLKGTKTTKENDNYRIVKLKLNLDNENQIKISKITTENNMIKKK